MALDPVTALLNIGGSIIDKIWPDKTEADKAKLELLKAQQAGDFKELEARFSAIVAEAQSKDPWTSRARPSFLYVMYALFLAAIPFGFAAIFAPEASASFVQNFTAWFRALPEELYWLFGTGYLGYSASRSFDKFKIGK